MLWVNNLRRLSSLVWCEVGFDARFLITYVMKSIRVSLRKLLKL